MFDFTGHVVCVTGAGAGIGFGVARAFHEAGARVALGDLREAALERAAARLGDRARVFAGAVDVREPDSVAAFLSAAERALGAVTVAIANAGIYPNSPVLEMSLEEWNRVMDTNLRGVFLTCQAAARSMVARGGPGKIITVSSGAYLSGRVGAAHYCASKAGVVMFTRVLALELAPHLINVNSVAPGLVEVEGEVSPVSREYIDPHPQYSLGPGGHPARHRAGLSVSGLAGGGVDDGRGSRGQRRQLGGPLVPAAQLAPSLIVRGADRAEPTMASARPAAGGPDSEARPELERAGGAGMRIGTAVTPRWAPAPWRRLDSPAHWPRTGS